MKVLSLVVCALACANVAQSQSHPQVLEETSTIPPPDSSWTYFGRFVAVDDNWALVQGDRFVPDPGAESGTRQDGAAFLYEKVGTAWVYRGVLGAIEAVDEWTRPGLAMRGGVAMVIQKTARIFERNGSTWTQAAATFPPVQGEDIEIANGKILVPKVSCSWDAVVMSKVAGTWTAEDTLTGDLHECGDNPETPRLDLDTRAAIFNAEDSESETPVIKLFQPGSQGGAPWTQFAEIARPADAPIFGPDVAILGSTLAATGSRDTGTIMFRDLASRNIENMNPVDGAMQPGSYSATSLAHNDRYFFQRNFSYDRNAWVVNVFTVAASQPAEQQRVFHIGQLVASRGGLLGSDIDISGNRVIVGGRVGFIGDNAVRVYDLPATFTHRGTWVDDFQQDGVALFDWQQTAGSAFAVVNADPVGTLGIPNRVFRQSSTVGDAAAYLPQTSWREEAIEAEITPTSFNGADRWVGLMVRRFDDANYYYVTARASGTVQLRKKVNGGITVLGSVPYPVVAGRKIRLRLEAVGRALRVYIDNQQYITAYDGALARGVVGTLMYRASADYDNVVISQGAHTSIFVSDFTTPNNISWIRDGGSWQQQGGTYAQTDATSLNSRSFVGAPTDDHVVQVRVRINEFGGGADPWVGVIARYADPQNYTYVALRRSGQIMLRYWLDGDGPFEIDRVPFPVTPGTWYTIRYENLFWESRVYVNDRLVLQGFATRGKKGKVGLMTYRAAAEFDDFRAYQP